LIQIRAWLQIIPRTNARFDVAHDKQRPFSVEAGEGVVTALGTTFVIRKTADDVLVTLIEGIVAVARQKQLITISHSPDEHEDIAQQLVYSKKGISKADIVDIPEVTAWQRGRLVFDNNSLPEVVAELNRYSDRKIIIADRSLRPIRVTGVFDAGDNHSAIEALKTYFSMRLETDPRGNFILKANTDFADAPDGKIGGYL
jgi:transmembrane sensor